jgi:hypothetical protein
MKFSVLAFFAAEFYEKYFQADLEFHQKTNLPHELPEVSLFLLYRQ